MTNYCTLDDVKKELVAKQAVNTTEEPKVRNYIRTVSSRIDELMGTPRRPFFAPYTEQRKFKVSPRRIDSVDNVFWLDNYPLLSVSNVLRGTSDITSIVEIYTDREEVDRGLRITDNYSSWYDCSGQFPPVFVKVTGEWGWNEDYDNAWDAVDELAADMLIDATTLTVVDADGADLEGYTPRFSPGNLIKVGSELMDVLSVDTATNILTVRRARNGTTAAAHTTADEVSIYQVDIRIRRIAIRQSAMLYARRGAFQVETLDGVGVITYPLDMLAELRATLQGFQYA
jgi:hypothetical protein